jgi:prepilin-type N-terminal cleavage/methylation domain-containing protein
VTERRGLTLIELLAALALLGLITGVAALRLRPVTLPAGDWRSDSVAALRRRALARGRAQSTVIVGATGGPYRLTALPGGRVLADSALATDPFTGQVREAR